MSRVTYLVCFISALTQNSVSPHPVGVTSLVYLLFFLSLDLTHSLSQARTHIQEREKPRVNTFCGHRIVKSRGQNKHFFLPPPLSVHVKHSSTATEAYWTVWGEGGVLCIFRIQFYFFKGPVSRDFRLQDCLTNHLLRPPDYPISNSSMF
jgi:hypothetical protein